MSKKLNNKVALVTGASSGIGRATALQLAQHGAKVVVTARRRDRLDELVGEIERQGGQALAVDVDLAAPGAADKLVAASVERFEKLDILVNNAGFAIQQLVTGVEEQEVRRLFEVNFFGVVSLTRAALPELKKARGSVVNVASVAGLVGMPLHAYYAASKHALIGLAESMAFELAVDDVRVATICPGPVATEFMESVSGAKYDEWLTSNFRFAFDQPETIARAIVSAAARRKSGTIVPTWRSYFQVVISSLGPVTRYGVRYFIKKALPALNARPEAA